LLPLAVHQVLGGGVRWIAQIEFCKRLLDTGPSFLVGQTAARLAAPVAAAAALACAGLALLAARADRTERRGGGLALYVGGTGILLTLVLSALGADYLLAKNLLPVLVPLLIAVSAGLGARAVGRAGLLAAGALAVLSTGVVVLTATRHDLQRPDWRSVAAALGPAREPRLIVAPRNAGDPLRAYRANARWAPPRTALVREVVVVGWVQPADVGVPLPEGFRRVSQRKLLEFGMVAFQARRALGLDPRRLASTEVGAPAQGRAAVLIDRPG
jgi:hypothetical protein